jgi:hypothetical protein
VHLANVISPSNPYELEIYLKSVTTCLDGEKHSPPGTKVFLLIAQGTIPGDGDIWQIVETVGTPR